MLKEELRIAIKAVIEAGVEILKVYESDFDHELKDDKSPLTLADKKANDVINSYLQKTSIPIISEENKQVNYDVRKNWTSCWIVDPLDGTKEFIKRNGEFTVNIALVENGKPILGIIYVPVKKTLYFGNVKSKASFRKVLSDPKESVDAILDEAEPIQYRAAQSNLIRVVASRSHMNQETENFIANLTAENKKVEIISQGSSLKFCLVAEGNADIYPRFAPTMEWDTAAAQAICNAIGVHVISQETKKPLIYNKENLLNPWFLVSKN
ncbi:MAG: 3'(2'),5'-bisphosphate nucleotidase CysQ [Flavobacteriaceae bacterium]|nr:3'(2'),5'-bisphosphate nucleotidase CysQ [Flavobacteriaceae bacterium]